MKIVLPELVYDDAKRLDYDLRNYICAERIPNALEAIRRYGKDEKGGDAGSPKEMGRDSERSPEKDGE